MSDTHKHKNKRKYLSKLYSGDETLNDKDYPIEMFKAWDRENGKKGNYNSRIIRNKERYGRNKKDFKIEEDEKD